MTIIFSQQNYSIERAERKKGGQRKERKWIEEEADFTERHSQGRNKTSMLNTAEILSLANNNRATFKNSLVVDSDDEDDNVV